MKRLPLLLMLCGAVLLPLLFSQTSQAPDSLKMRVEGLFDEEKYAEAEALLWPELATARIARDWKRFYAAAEYLLRADSKKNDAVGAVAHTDTLLSVLDRTDTIQAVVAGRLLAWKALNLRKLGRWAESLEAYQTAIRLLEQNKFLGRQMTYSYRNAAQIHMRYSDNGQAIELLQAALRTDTSRKDHALIYSQLSGAYFFLDSLSAAEYYYQKGVSLATQVPFHAALLASAGAAVALKRDQLETARHLTLESLTYYESDPDEIDNCLRSYVILADISARQGQLVEAEAWYRKAEYVGKTGFKGKSREMAILYLAWGNFLENKGAMDAALDYYQKAIIQVFPGFDNPDPVANPPMSEAYIESQAMFALASKGAALLKKPAPTPADRANAADCFELSFAVAEKLRRTYGDDADKLTLAGENRGYQRLAALNLWQLWQTQNDPAILARLFRLLEQSKAQALADALRQQRGLALGGIPDSLLAREQKLRLAAAYADLDLKSAVLSGETSDSLERVRRQDEAFRRQRQYADFLADLGKQYPQFQHFTTETLPADPVAIQAALPDSAALFSWFDAGERYLCVVVRREGLSGFEVPGDSAFDRRLSGFLALLADKSAQQSAPDEYFAEAFALGQQLLPDGVTAGLNHLVIVPDGRLCFLPFEALLTAPYRGNFGGAPYLLRTQTVRYAWSASLLTGPPARLAPATGGFLQIAPFVETARDGLAPLRDSGRERPSGGGVTTLIGRDATAAEFLDKARTYNVLQLSTHAHAGGKTQPGIELYDRTLQLSEIYAQRLPAALVALSACETGAGEYAEGEGVLSLARAFAYAGAESLVASHWTVNERSTAELFIHFYQKLEGGTARSEALQQAKLDWLNGPEADARKAPWYWAAFTLSGGDGPVDLAGSGGWTWWWAGLLAAGVAGGVFFLRRRRIR